MFYSKFANVQQRRNIIYATKLYGTQADVFLPKKLTTIRSEYDRIDYESIPKFTGKLLINSIFKSKKDNLSNISIGISDEEDLMWSIEEFPIGSLIVLRINTGISNFQVENIYKSVDDDQVYFYKYMINPYTVGNKMINPRVGSSVTNTSNGIGTVLVPVSGVSGTISDKPQVDVGDSTTGIITSPNISTTKNEGTNQVVIIPVDKDVFDPTFGGEGNPLYDTAPAPNDNTPTSLDVSDRGQMKKDGGIELGVHPIEKRQLFVKRLDRRL